MQQPKAAPPKHLGLSRRQSYDPLSSGRASLSQSLSLGTLPSPQFGHLPSGLRSVPATETKRGFLTGSLGGVRSVSGTSERDLPRTPGGSLVVGSEVFGFGKTAAKDARERWGDGSVGEGAIDETEGEKTPLGGDAEDASGWPTDFEAAIASTKKGDFILGTDVSNLKARSKHGLETASADFTMSGLPRPTLRTYGSSADLRSPPTAHEEPARAPTRLTSNPSPAPPSASGEPVGLGYHQSATGPGDAGSGAGVFPAESTGSGYVAAQSYQRADARGPGGPTGFDSVPISHPQLSPDDLAFGLSNVNLGSESYRQQGGRQPSNSYQQRQPTFSPGPFRDPAASRQQSGPYGAYYFQHGSPYLPADPYMSYTPDPANYFQAPDGTAASGDVRRDSSPAQSWGMPVGQMVVPDFSQQANHTSRQSSFSYSPAATPQMAYGMPPYAGGLSERSGSFPPLGAPQPLIGRGGRPEYVAPGPSVPPTPYMYGSFPAQSRYTSYPDDYVRSMRSPLLDEFRTNRHRNWELIDLAGHIVEFSGDQLGSRHIQTKLETATPDEKDMVFNEILPNMLQLSNDVFANYVIQKFFEHGNQVQKTALAHVLEGHVLELSLQVYGCRVIQKAIEYLLVDQQVRLVKELEHHVLKCARDAQSNHVIQRALERVPSEQIAFIPESCVGHVHALATHSFGCRVLQRIFENCPPAQTKMLMEEFHRYTQNLIQDQYGNYVVQWIIEKGDPNDRSQVISKVYGQVLVLSQQKFASNVVEKCMIFGNEEERFRLIGEVLATGPDGTSIVKAMLVHPFANYVMQKILHTASGPQREALFAQTTVQLANLRKYSPTYSKHLLAIEKLLTVERGRPY